MTPEKPPKSTYNLFMENWSTDIADAEIARELGVTVDTIREVKRDLCEDAEILCTHKNLPILFDE